MEALSGFLQDVKQISLFQNGKNLISFFNKDDELKSVCLYVCLLLICNQTKSDFSRKSKQTLALLLQRIPGRDNFCSKAMRSSRLHIFQRTRCLLNEKSKIFFFKSI